MREHHIDSVFHQSFAEGLNESLGGRQRGRLTSNDHSAGKGQRKLTDDEHEELGGDGHQSEKKTSKPKLKKHRNNSLGAQLERHSPRKDKDRVKENKQ